MDDNDELMIVGAKKKINIKNYDKNEINACKDSFVKYILSADIVNKDKLIEMCMNGDVDKNLIRPTIWKTLLHVLPIESRIEEWIETVNKQRIKYKNKMKSLNTLKKFSGDPLGGSQDVILLFIFN